jgi:hypothetical protein
MHRFGRPAVQVQSARTRESDSSTRSRSARTVVGKRARRRAGSITSTYLSPSDSIVEEQDSVMRESWRMSLEAYAGR